MFNFDGNYLKTQQPYWKTGGEKITEHEIT